MIIEYIFNKVASQFKLDPSGNHGVKHWLRVIEIGEQLSMETKADLLVVRLFGLLHDSKRENEAVDSEHGLRAALFIEDLYLRNLLQITPIQFGQLTNACQIHSDSDAQTNDVTIMTCLDADRLDLWRLGIEPDPARLYTDFAKLPQTIEWARNLLRPIV